MEYYNKFVSDTVVKAIIAYKVVYHCSSGTLLAAEIGTLDWLRYEGILYNCREVFDRLFSERQNIIPHPLRKSVTIYAESWI